MKILWTALLAISFQTLVCQAEENEIPYDTVNRTMIVMKAVKKGGVECVPFYIKSSVEDSPLDPAKANFHLKSKEGEEMTLKVEPFKPTPAFAATHEGEDAIKKGYTHIIWIPKGQAKFKEGSIVHSLPKGTIDMAYFAYFEGSLSLP